MTQVKGNVTSEDQGNVDFFLKKITPWDKDGVPGFLYFKLGNGQTLKVDVARLPEDMKLRLMYHGLSQKVGDMSSGFSKGKDFAGAFEAMSGTVAHLEQNEWTKGARERGVNLQDMAEVIAKLKKFKLEDVLKSLQGMTEEAIKEMAKHPAIAAGLNDLRHMRRQEALKEAAKGTKLEFDLKL